MQLLCVSGVTSLFLNYFDYLLTCYLLTCYLLPVHSLPDYLLLAHLLPVQSLPAHLLPTHLLPTSQNQMVTPSQPVTVDGILYSVL
ncbi:hypothetical protein EB796_014302 [Bugula neritina]|uniref:Uncharacterized protein n=1 Tax=Bugula neritina TaxID=10212 RepID=A0A7J7JM11_BUGNE|nr:hypothetical protein EB796_014302 [Bugula neritina]